MPERLGDAIEGFDEFIPLWRKDPAAFDEWYRRMGGRHPAPATRYHETHQRRPDGTYGLRGEVAAAYNDAAEKEREERQHARDEAQARGEDPWGKVFTDDPRHKTKPRKGRARPAQERMPFDGSKDRAEGWD